MQQAGIFTYRKIDFLDYLPDLLILQHIANI